MRRLKFLGLACIAALLLYFGATGHKNRQQDHPSPTTTVTTAASPAAPEPITVTASRSCTGTGGKTKFTVHVANNTANQITASIKVAGSTVAQVQVAAHGTANHDLMVENNAGGGRTVISVTDGHYTTPELKPINC